MTQPRTGNPRIPIYRLAAARAISIGGGAAAFAALMYVVFDKTGSAKWVAATLFFTFGVSGLMSPIGGLIADRFDRKWVMIWSDLAGAACFVVMAFLHDPALLIAVAFIAALAETPFWSASSGAIPNIATPEDLSKANALLVASRNLGLMLGPVIGGVMVASLGAQWVFLFNAATFVFSAALVWTVRANFQEERDEEQATKGLRVGFSYLAHEPVLRTILAAWSGMVLGMGMSMVADLPLVKSFVPDSVALGYGALIACWGGGALIGTIFGRWMNARNEGYYIVYGTAVIALGTAATALAPGFVIALAGVLIAGIGDSSTIVADESILQRRTPDEIRSRVASVSQALWQIALAISYIFGGIVVGYLGPQGMYGVGAIMGAIATVVLIPILGIMRKEADERDKAMDVDKTGSGE